MNNIIEKELISVKFIEGIGNLHVEVMFIGEAPGRQEEQVGEPFIGRSGNLLNKWIKLLGLSRSDVYLTNVVKVRPQDNRTPTNEEIKSWSPLLHKEIEEICPKFIVAVGKVAEKSLKFLGYENFTVLYHPAYILRNSHLEYISLERIEKLRLKLKESK